MSGIPQSEYRARRGRVRRGLKDAAGLVFAGDARDEDASWRPHPHFEYLTGVADEPGSILLLDGTHPVESRRDVLFLRPLDPEKEQWDGLRDHITASLRERTGFQTVYRTGMLGRVLAIVSERVRQLATLHPTVEFDQPLPPDLDIWRKVAKRAPGLEVVNRSSLIGSLRAVKSTAEVAMIKEAIKYTSGGFEDAIRSIEPGTNESIVQSTLEHGYAVRGSDGLGFDSIVGSGINTTVLHYGANDQKIEDGELVLIDSGARCGGYGADISRTVPVSGVFSQRQREIYEVVLQAEEAAIRAVKPGATFAVIDAAARKVITEAGFGDAFIHGIGHHLGLETHDSCGNDPLKSGAVITIEPGIYLPDERIGVRIEDDILVTPKGRRNLSAAIPRKVADIENLMSSR